MTVSCRTIILCGILCAPPAWVHAQGLPEASPKVEIQRDLVYGSGGDHRLQLDLAMPVSGSGPYPVILCIHGGGWKQGSRHDLDQTIAAFAGRGYVAVTIEYRLVPTARFPAQIEDCKAAVRWLRANAAKYKIRTDRIGAIGFSAGAHLACLLGVTAPKDGLEGLGGNPEQSSGVQAVVSYFGPTDLTLRDWTKDVEDSILVPFLGATLQQDPTIYKRASPVSYVAAGEPPFLFFHGTEDQLVSIHQSQELVEKLKAAGVDAQLITMKGESHGWRGHKLRHSIEQTLSFFDDHLKK